MDAKGFAYNVANCYANIIRQRFIPESEDLLTDCRNMGLWNKGDDDSEFELPTKKKPSNITANNWENGYAPISDAAMTKMRTNYAGAADEVEIGLNKQKHCVYLGSDTFLAIEGDEGTELSRSSLTSAINSGEEVTVHATTFGQPLVTSCAVAASNDKHYKIRSDELEYAQHIADVIFTVAAFYLDIFEAMLSVMPFVGDGLAAGVAMFRAMVEFIFNVQSLVTSNIQFTLGELQTHPTDLATNALKAADANARALAQCAVSRNIN